MPKGRAKKNYKNITKDHAKDIIERLSRGENLSAADIAEMTGCSLGSSTKFKSYLKNIKLQKLKDDDDVPSAYFFPSTVKETIDVIMYDLGFKVVGEIKKVKRKKIDN